jgi:hypothetical protein
MRFFLHFLNLKWLTFTVALFVLGRYFRCKTAFIHRRGIVAHKPPIPVPKFSCDALGIAREHIHRVGTHTCAPSPVVLPLDLHR